MKIFSDKWQVEGDLRDRLLPGRARRSARAANVVGRSIIHDSAAASCHPSPVTRHREQGIALIITLIMLAITLVMAVAFLALAKRERASVSTNTDTIVAQEAAKSGLAMAQAQIAANMLSGFNGVASSNAYNLHVFVSTNYINPAGFVSGIANPTNVNYVYSGGGFLNAVDLAQNVANLWFLPRAPVFVPTNSLSAPLAYDFRYYLDLNENGLFDPNGMQPVISDNTANPYYNTNGVPIPNPLPANLLSNFCVGDPEWIGVLEHPDAPHGPNNHFTSRYAFIAVPAGNALDINYIHNQAQNATGPNGPNDYFMRNQGVGSWEINLAAFLADLNTNQFAWGAIVGSGPGSPPNSAAYYQYNEPGQFNDGVAFDDARALLAYRYNFNPLPSAYNVLGNGSAPSQIPYNGIDDYSHGPLQTTFDTNEDYLSLPVTTVSWSGADNTNHYFTIGDFFNQPGLSGFTNRLRTAGAYVAPNGMRPTYDRYTYYRMLDQLASDSTPDDGRVNLNYSNAVVNYKLLNGVSVPAGIAVVPGAETNLVRWKPLDFFTAAADQMLRVYSSNWWSSSYMGFTNTFAVTAPFSITNIPVWVSNRFVYTPAVHRLLQLAANIYDATTNGNYNLPHVFRPVFERQNNLNRDIYIIGYIPVTPLVNGENDPQLDNPYDITQLSAFAPNQPILDSKNSPINVYGVPWIIGAKKGLPGFNQLAMVPSATVARKLEVSRSSLNPKMAIYQTNVMYVMGVTNYVDFSFWNSYSNAYIPRSGSQLTVYASDVLNMTLENSSHIWNANTNFILNQGLSSWPGTQWSGSQPSAASFLSYYSPYTFQSPLTYDLGNHVFSLTDYNMWFPILQYPQFDQFALMVTNYLQAYILDGNNVIDYVQLRDPMTVSSLNTSLADPPYQQAGNVFYQWSTNVSASSTPIPYGMLDQLYVSGHPSAPIGPTPATQMPGNWAPAPTPMGNASPAAEAAYFNGFFTPTFQYTFPNGTTETFVNHELAMQAPYTPQRTVLTSFLLQANDPLVHYLASDLNAQAGALAIWNNKVQYRNGISTSNDLGTLPSIPGNPVGGRYQPWGQSGQMAYFPNGIFDVNAYNLAYKDPLIWQADNWDFPTNLYPTVGWLGRVHRGTPWQTVFLKSTNILNCPQPNSAYGVGTWANWTGNIQTNIYSYYFDNYNTAPQQDYLLFDIFTTRLNDNAARGTLPVNMGMGRSDGGLAAWSALFSGMVAITNNLFPPPAIPSSVTYGNLIINPAGPDQADSPLWKIVNGPFGINQTRTNMIMFPSQSFTHVGSILATPALSVASPFLNTNGIPSRTLPSANQLKYAINDEEYEWLPQQMMGLVRGTEARYVLYCYGQTLRPAPGGTVLGGNYFQLVTNYQVTAESVIRAVVRVENANSATPHVVVESYNVLPPN